MTSDDKASVWFMVIVALLCILFAGEPDIVDAIIVNLMSGAK